MIIDEKNKKLSEYLQPMLYQNLIAWRKGKLEKYVLYILSHAYKDLTKSEAEPAHIEKSQQFKSWLIKILENAFPPLPPFICYFCKRDFNYSFRIDGNTLYYFNDPISRGLAFQELDKKEIYCCNQCFENNCNIKKAEELLEKRWKQQKKRGKKRDND